MAQERPVRQRPLLSFLKPPAAADPEAPSKTVAQGKFVAAAIAGMKISIDRFTNVLDSQNIKLLDDVTIQNLTDEYLDILTRSKLVYTDAKRSDSSPLTFESMVRVNLFVEKLQTLACRQLLKDNGTLEDTLVNVLKIKNDVATRDALIRGFAAGIIMSFSPKKQTASDAKNAGAGDFGARIQKWMMTNPDLNIFINTAFDKRLNAQQRNPGIQRAVVQSYMATQSLGATTPTTENSDKFHCINCMLNRIYQISFALDVLTHENNSKWVTDYVSKMKTLNSTAMGLIKTEFEKLNSADLIDFQNIGKVMSDMSSLTNQTINTSAKQASEATNSKVSVFFAGLFSSSVSPTATVKPDHSLTTINDIIRDFKVLLQPDVLVSLKVMPPVVTADIISSTVSNSAASSSRSPSPTPQLAPSPSHSQTGTGTAVASPSHAPPPSPTSSLTPGKSK